MLKALSYFFLAKLGILAIQIIFRKIVYPQAFNIYYRTKKIQKMAIISEK